MQTLNGVGDLIDLQHALAPSTIPDWKKMTSKEFSLYLAQAGHCSALVKVGLPLGGGYSDLVWTGVCHSSLKTLTHL